MCVNRMFKSVFQLTLLWTLWSVFHNSHVFGLAATLVLNHDLLKSSAVLHNAPAPRRLVLRKPCSVPEYEQVPIPSIPSIRGNLRDRVEDGCLLDDDVSVGCVL